MPSDKDITRLELIARLGREYRILRDKYPDEKNPDGYRKLAVMLAITALAEEEYGVKDWHELLPKRERRRRTNHHMPTSGTTITVESCLAELKMFPDVEIHFTARANAQGWRVWLGLRGGNFYGVSLDEAMAQVREWRRIND